MADSSNQQIGDSEVTGARSRVRPHNQTSHPQMPPRSASGSTESGVSELPVSHFSWSSNDSSDSQNLNSRPAAGKHGSNHCSSPIPPVPTRAPPPPPLAIQPPAAQRRDGPSSAPLRPPRWVRPPPPPQQSPPLIPQPAILEVPRLPGTNPPRSRKQQGEVSQNSSARTLGSTSLLYSVTGPLDPLRMDPTGLRPSTTTPAFTPGGRPPPPGILGDAQDKVGKTPATNAIFEAGGMEAQKEAVETNTTGVKGRSRFAKFLRGKGVFRKFFSRGDSKGDDEIKEKGASKHSSGSNGKGTGKGKEKVKDSSSTTNNINHNPPAATNPLALPAPQLLLPLAPGPPLPPPLTSSRPARVQKEKEAERQETKREEDPFAPSLHPSRTLGGPIQHPTASESRLPAVRLAGAALVSGGLSASASASASAGASGHESSPCSWWKPADAKKIALPVSVPSAVSGLPPAVPPAISAAVSGVSTTPTVKQQAPIYLPAPVCSFPPLDAPRDRPLVPGRVGVRADASAAGTVAGEVGAATGSIPRRLPPRPVPLSLSVFLPTPSRPILPLPSSSTSAGLVGVDGGLGRGGEVHPHADVDDLAVMECLFGARFGSVAPRSVGGRRRQQ